MNPEINRDSIATTALLPKSQRPENETSGSSSISGAVFNVSSSMVGAGIMSVPATVKVLGIIPGFAMILIMAFVVELTVEFLLRYTNYTGEANSYGGVMAESFGKFGSVSLQICVMITNLGALIIYLIIIGKYRNHHSCVFQPKLTRLSYRRRCFIRNAIRWSITFRHFTRMVRISLVEYACVFGLVRCDLRDASASFAPSSRLVWIEYRFTFKELGISTPIVTKLTNFHRLTESLCHASAVSILLAVVFVVMISGMAIYAMLEGKTQELRLIPDFGDGFSFFNLFTTIPVLATALACHVTVHPVRAELENQSNMSTAVRISLILSVVIYFAVGFVGYLLFGDSIMADMLVNFDQASNSPGGLMMNAIVRLSYALHLMLVFPVIFYTLRANMDEMMFSHKSLLVNDTTRFVSLTCVLLAFIYFVAIAIPDIWYFFQFMGSTTVACIAFVFPAAIVLRDVHGISSRKDRVMAIMVIVLAVVTSGVTRSLNGAPSRSPLWSLTKSNPPILRKPPDNWGKTRMPPPRFEHPTSHKEAKRPNQSIWGSLAKRGGLAEICGVVAHEGIGDSPSVVVGDEK
ncbi:hypothetical protein LXL04_035117 [Taraxacum kok-saghyz]